MNPIADKMNFKDSFLDHINFDKRYMYRGSLTTPPYTELLFWTVIPEVIPIKSSTRDMFLWSRHT
jgi:carbonic anhydrase